jgi:membrane-associated phospholipid phosphatase
MAAITLLMLPGVVYLHAHYLLDVPAGLVVGFLGYAWSRWISR